MVFPQCAGATSLNRLSSAPPPPAILVTSRFPSSSRFPTFCDISDVPFSLPIRTSLVFPPLHILPDAAMAPLLALAGGALPVAADILVG